MTTASNFGSHALGIWTAGVLVGLRTFREEPVLGLKRLALPVSYWRSVEFAYVWRQLALGSGARVLDLGSPKDLATMLAKHRGYEVVATDILPEAIDLSERYARAQRLHGHGPGLVSSEVQDGRALTYEDGSFDAAYSVSVLEHIPDAGDSAAIRELVRVVRPGGLVVVTVPFDRRYRETFVDGAVYERKPVASEPARMSSICGSGAKAPSGPNACLTALVPCACRCHRWKPGSRRRCCARSSRRAKDTRWRHPSPSVNASASAGARGRTSNDPSGPSARRWRRPTSG
jgi:SAM-dependent methyltransferase